MMFYYLLIVHTTSRKKKNKAKEVLEAVEKAGEKASEGSPKTKRKMTPAEMAFKRVQEKRVSR